MMHLALLFFSLDAFVFLSLLIDELVEWAEHTEAEYHFDSTKLCVLTFATAMNLSGCLLMLFQIINNPTQH